MFMWSLRPLCKKPWKPPAARGRDPGLQAGAPQGPACADAANLGAQLGAVKKNDSNNNKNTSDSNPKEHDH